MPKKPPQPKEKIFVIENSPTGQNIRRIAIIKAITLEQAKERLYKSFPDASNIRVVEDYRLTNPMLNTAYLKTNNKTELDK